MVIFGSFLDHLHYNPKPSHLSDAWWFNCYFIVKIMRRNPFFNTKKHHSLKRCFLNFIWLPRLDSFSSVSSRSCFTLNRRLCFGKPPCYWMCHTRHIHKRLNFTINCSFRLGSCGFESTSIVSLMKIKKHHSFERCFLNFIWLPRLDSNQWPNG